MIQKRLGKHIKRTVQLDEAEFQSYSEAIEALQEKLQIVIRDDQRYANAKRADENDFLKGICLKIAFLHSLRIIVL